MERLQKYISECGIASRRKAEELIKQGKVSVNGKIITEMGYKVSPYDNVIVSGKKATPQNKIYIMINKPRGYITSVSDDRGRKTVMELIPDIKEKLFPVGRLDYDTEGLLILTNDGDFANRLIHPSSKQMKTYIARLDRVPDETSIKKLTSGIKIDDYIAKAEKLNFRQDAEDKFYADISISTGRNRQVRKMFEAVGCRVKRLKRVNIGEFNLGNLKPGEWRYLTKKEINNV